MTHLLQDSQRSEEVLVDVKVRRGILGAEEAHQIGATPIQT